MTWHFQTTVPGRLEAVRDLAEAARKALEAVWQPAEALDDAELVLVEACNNIAIHAYAGSGLTGNIDLDLAIENDELVITVQDTGAPFVPAEAPEDPFAESGRGIMLMQALASKVTFERCGEVNTLRCVMAPGTAAP